MGMTNAGDGAPGSGPGGPKAKDALGGAVSPSAQITDDSVNLDVFQLSDVGRVRTHNEDFLDYHIPKDPVQRQQKGMLCLVADGMGGHQAGEVASRQAVQFVVGQYYGDTTRDIGTSLVRAIRAANRLIHEQAQADPSKSGMGTTLVAAVILGHKVFVANVGDSRAYLIGQGGTTQITEDHSWVEEQVRAGLLTSEQARVHPQRNLVTRALGSKASVEVDLFEGQINGGDALLLCTDGLTGYVRDAEIEAIVRKNTPAEAGQILVDLAKERGGRDNISVMIISARVPAPAVPARAPRPARTLSLAPMLLGAVLLLALVAAGVVFLPGLLRKGGAIAEPTTVAVPTVSDVPALAASAVSATAVEVATATPRAIETSVPTETEQAEAGPTAEAVPTAPPTETSTGTPGPATVTLAPTETPSPTDTPTSTATNTATPTRTREPPRPPVLLRPDADEELQGEVEFEWAYSGELMSNESFQVLIWKDGAPGPHEGAADFSREPGPNRFKQKINLDDIDNTAKGTDADNYRWAVIVVDAVTKERKTLEGEGRRFYYPGRPATATPKPGCDAINCDTDCLTAEHPGVCPFMCVFCCGGCH